MRVKGGWAQVAGGGCGNLDGEQQGSHVGMGVAGRLPAAVGEMQELVTHVAVVMTGCPGSGQVRMQRVGIQVHGSGRRMRIGLVQFADRSQYGLHDEA